MMSGEGSSSTSVSIDSETSNKPFIFRTDPVLRGALEGAYEPVKLSIGPYHHGKNKLQEMEKYKHKYLQGLLRRRGYSRADYIKALMDVEKEARNYYAEDISLSREDFVKMMLLDGCFIIEILRRLDNPQKFQMDGPDLLLSLPYLFRDLLLFENQIPFFVLVLLFDMTKGPAEEKDLIRLAIDRLYGLISPEKPRESSYNIGREEKIVHLLSLMYNSWCSSMYTRLGKRSNSSEQMTLDLFPEQNVVRGAPPNVMSVKDPYLMSATAPTSMVAAAPKREKEEDVEIIKSVQELQEEEEEDGIEFKEGRMVLVHRSSSSEQKTLDPFRELKVVAAEAPDLMATPGPMPMAVAAPKREKEEDVAIGVQELQEGEEGIRFKEGPKLKDAAESVHELQKVSLAQGTSDFSQEPKVGAHKREKKEGPMPGEILESVYEPQKDGIEFKGGPMPEEIVESVYELQKDGIEFTGGPMLKEIIKVVHELQEDGIEFRKAKESTSWLDIKFKKGVIEIPAVIVQRSTKSLLRNLIIYEQYMLYRSHPLRYFVSSYAIFMNCLINSSKDVKTLRKAQIIKCWLSNDEEIADTFNTICNNKLVIPSLFFYTKVFEDVNKYCSQNWNTWWAHTKRDYFNTPCTTISFVAATFLLSLTIAQTVFSILAYLQ